MMHDTWIYVDLRGSKSAIIRVSHAAGLQQPNSSSIQIYKFKFKLNGFSSPSRTHSPTGS